MKFNLKYLGLNNDKRNLFTYFLRNNLGSVTGAKVWKVSQAIYEQKPISST